jgi:hypothetical protein
MPYTLWSRGRLLGETELAYRRWKPCFRAGDFAPNELGEKLMPIIVGVGPALHALYDRHAEDLRRQRAETESDDEDGYPEEVRRSTEYADAVSIADELESLALELRDPSGAVVDTEDIWLNDTYRLIAIGREAIRKEDPDFEFDEPEPWETPPPRYQIMVALRGYDESMREGGMKLDLDPELEAELKARAGEEFDNQFDCGFAEDLDELLNDESHEELGESDETLNDG